MQKVLLLIIGLLPAMLWGQAQRTVLIEEFTNASCPPCASQNPAFNALLAQNTDRVVSIKYQAPFPGFDPMNQANPTQVATRSNYYGLTGVPTAWIDGVLPDNSYGGGVGAWNITANSGYAGGPYGYNQAALNYAMGVETPVEIELSHSFNAELTEITIVAKVKNVGAEDLALASGRFHVVLIEEEVIYPEPPGSTNEDEFFGVMRRMYPDANGTPLTALAAGDSIEYTFTEAIPTYTADKRELAVVAFLQNNTNKAVWQSAISEPIAVENDVDLALTANVTAAPQGLCGASITPTARVTNNGGVNITSLEVGMLLNGVDAETQQWTGDLAPGATADIAFTPLQLPGGSTALEFVVVDVNDGAIDLNSLNNETAPALYSSLGEDPYGTSLTEDNENYTYGYPAIAAVSEAFPGATVGSGGGTFHSARRSDLVTASGANIGGYGQSERSIFVNFYWWDPAGPTPDEATMTYPKIDLTGQTNVHLKFDRAAARYQTSNDRFQILASTDCGETWTVVYNRAGAELATGGATNAFFLPTAAQWTTDSVSLSQFDGVPELNIQFKAISNYGNNLYIDNINILGTVVGTNDLANLLDGKVAVFPNPTAEVANIEFELVEATPVTIEILNINGQVVAVLDYNRDYLAGSYMRTWAPEHSGIYLARVRTNLGEITQRIVVAK